MHELLQRAEELFRAYRHGTDDAPYHVVREIAQLPTPYAMAVTAAICDKLNQVERSRFIDFLLVVAQGRYRSVFARRVD